MFSGLLARPTLTIHLQEDQVFVQPHFFHPDSPGLAKDPILNGTVNLTLPAPRAVSKLKVVLEGVQIVGGDNLQYESSVILHKDLEIKVDETLPAGSHVFSYSFLLPNNTPVYQRSRYGRVDYHVRASATFPGTLPPSLKIKSDRLAFFVIATSMGLGNGLPPTDLSLQVFSEDLGPVGIGFTSPHLTIASLLSAQVTLLATPPGQRVEISAIRVIITQKHEVHFQSGKVHCPDDLKVLLRAVNMGTPPCEGDSTEPAEPYRRAMAPQFKNLSGKSFDDCGGVCGSASEPHVPKSLFLSEPHPLADVGPNEVYAWSRVCRVPDGAFLRPTTIEGSDNEPIVIGHRLSAEIRYSIEGSNEEKTFTVGKDITLGHCAELADTFFLPTYDGASSADKTVGHGGSVCSCMVPLRVMIERDRATFLRASTPSTPPTQEAIEASRNKTPSYFHDGPQ